MITRYLAIGKLDMLELSIYNWWSVLPLKWWTILPITDEAFHLLNGGLTILPPAGGGLTSSCLMVEGALQY